jgi:hypothetical protein
MSESKWPTSLRSRSFASTSSLHTEHAGRHATAAPQRDALQRPLPQQSQRVRLRERGKSPPAQQRTSVRTSLSNWGESRSRRSAPLRSLRPPARQRITAGRVRRGLLRGSDGGGHRGRGRLRRPHHGRVLHARTLEGHPELPHRDAPPTRSAPPRPAPRARQPATHGCVTSAAFREPRAAHQSVVVREQQAHGALRGLPASEADERARERPAAMRLPTAIASARTSGGASASKSRISVTSGSPALVTALAQVARGERGAPQSTHLMGGIHSTGG